MKSKWTDDFIGKSLFMIYVGTEDYLNFTKNKPNVDISAQQAFVTSVTNKFKNDISVSVFIHVITRLTYVIWFYLYIHHHKCINNLNLQLLYSLNATKFAIQLLAPLGCLPISRQEYKTGNECYEPLNDLAKQHNDKIGPILNDLAKEHPGFQFTVFDFYNAVLRRTRTNLSYSK